MIFRSPYGNVAIPDSPLTDFVFDRARSLGAKPALIDGPSGRAVSFVELEEAIRRVAKGLSSRGFAKGDVFAIYAPNVPEYAVAFHGVARLGGVTTTVNPLYTPEELRRQLDDAGATRLLTVPPFLDKAAEACRGSRVEEVFVFGDSDGATPFSALLENDGDPPEVDIDTAEDLVALPYSSGTTGLQKGVMLTHRNLVANLVQTSAAFEGGLTERDVCIGILPFFHIYGMLVIMNLALWKGASIVTMPRFDLQGFLELMQRYRITSAHLVPPIVLGLSKHPMVDQYDLTALRWIMSGAAPLGEEVAGACAERLGCFVLQGYGLTETSPVSHCNPINEARIKPGSVGPPVPGTECRIVSPESGLDVGPGENGEIWIRGPQVMKGYLNNVQATRAAIDEEGWFHSGDVGYADEDGYFFIVDRMKELIKYKGFQVAPAELEAVLLSHPAVADAAVVPKPDEEAGEIPKAFLVLREEVPKQAILDFVAERVAPYKKIREIEIIDAIPKSPSGKILRRLLR
ncbi:MAG TPA: 4-coumarate--CoA ligase family protein [Vicinamibacteria bacterium]|nr:4-coumarate--CoA ligase family protein [Vicinamibacteria bacterium]